MTVRGIFARSAETDGFWSDGTPRCECEGECGGSARGAHLHEDDDGRCLEQHGEKALGFRGGVVLAIVLHRDGDARAMCQRCRERREARRETEKATAGASMLPLFEGGS